MYTELGVGSLALAWVAALYVVAMSGWHCFRNEEPAHRSSSRILFVVHLNFFFLFSSVLVLWLALISEQYQLSFVWETTNPATPTHLRVSALWGGQRGSLLFWSTLMSGFSAIAALAHGKNRRRLLIPALMVAQAVVAFFVGLVLFLENPFAQFWLTEDYYSTGILQDYILRPNAVVNQNEGLRELLAVSARGGSSLLRHPAMLIHPPMLYLGFVGMVMPFAFAMAALLRNELDASWIQMTRRWLLLAWICLSAGLLLGGRWAYDVLGWGGYWGWDPVENAALLPWLAGTALFHSLLIQEKRGIFKTWNLILVLLAFSSVLFATFATRSGLVESVHSFARSEIGWPLFIFWAGLTLLAVLLIAYRHHNGDLQASWRVLHWSSREFLFSINNLLFTVLIFAIFWGSFGAPIFSELLLRQTRIMRVQYFEQISVPLFIALFFLMGVTPLAAWGASSIRRIWPQGRYPILLSTAFAFLLVALGMRHSAMVLGLSGLAFAGMVSLQEIGRPFRIHRQQRKAMVSALWRRWRRNQRRLGGYFVHLGIVVIGIGIAASSLFQRETQQTLQLGGDTLPFAEYELGYSHYQPAIATDGRQLDIAHVTVYRDGQPVTTLQPRLDYFPDLTMTVAGVHRPFAHDLYVLLVPWQTVEAARAELYEKATFKIYWNPLVSLVWWGGIILVFGVILCGWGDPLRSNGQKKPADESLD
ncbi:MAG: cytochrome c biogenesis protein CcsA [Chloroflexi bacterium]|nr:cytochrome c biogenesis protein CcsA [Chloroflexota bacterium]